MYKVLATGSSGNAILYHNSILVDCGVPFSTLKPDLYNIQIVLLTHCHGDHINKATLSKLVYERPALRIGCCEWMAEYMANNDYPDFIRKNLDVYKVGHEYNYGSFQIIPVKLYHDVPNCGYRIFKDNHKTIHITDTVTLDGITAPKYDLYAIEHNYDDNIIHEVIAELESQGKFAHQKGSIETHLSEQKAKEFIEANRKETSIVLKLHETSFIR